MYFHPGQRFLAAFYNLKCIFMTERKHATASRTLPIICVQTSDMAASAKISMRRINRENSDCEAIPRSVSAFCIFSQNPPQSERRDSFSPALQFTDALRLGFLPPSSHQLQLTCHAEYQGLLFSPCEMKIHGNAH